MAVRHIVLRQRETQLGTRGWADLDGQRVHFRAAYSSFEDRWSLWILDATGAQLVGPMKLVPGIDLLRPYRHIEGVPPGELFVSSKDRVPPTKNTIDEPVRLLYREAAA